MTYNEKRGKERKIKRGKKGESLGERERMRMRERERERVRGRGREK